MTLKVKSSSPEPVSFLLFEKATSSGWRPVSTHIRLKSLWWRPISAIEVVKMEADFTFSFFFFSRSTFQKYKKAF